MKLLFISLGCDKNLVDTEFMLGMIRDAGTFDGQPIEMTDDEYQADIIIINTCCFINDAKEESINTILEMAEHKRDAKVKGADRDRMPGAALQGRDPQGDSGGGCDPWNQFLRRYRECHNGGAGRQVLREF